MLQPLAGEKVNGDALMAIPLYGNDYDKGNTRDIYLPKGSGLIVTMEMYIRDQLCYMIFLFQ